MLVLQPIIIDSQSWCTSNVVLLTYLLEKSKLTIIHFLVMTGWAVRYHPPSLRQLVDPRETHRPGRQLCRSSPAPNSDWTVCQVLGRYLYGYLIVFIWICLQHLIVFIWICLQHLIVFIWTRLQRWIVDVLIARYTMRLLITCAITEQWSIIFVI